MACIYLFILALVAYAASLPNLHNQIATFCRLPDKSDYTLIQDPFFGDIDHGQPGITFTTAYGDGDPRWFMVYQNGIDFKPYRAMKISSNTTVFIDLTTSCRTFSGRLVRGSAIDFNGDAHNLGTWTEINWEDYPVSYAGVSVIEGGNDGPVLLQSEDPSTPIMGFPQDIMPEAPDECRVKKDSGGMALKPTDKDGYDKTTRDFTKGMLDIHKVSVDKNYTATVMSHNGRFNISFLRGNH
ncbi:hypothetical protein F53441_956 [Fusarium austroafricanum]|uniref:Uncharacterized protein n=1 Tax=Fusarium austroafricanum TaxID=2364996 RepID=A0A8H4KUM1_9HYPO|nr:hypothetical protein F53441_956 [Fusarium austroafricanum]